MEKEVLGEAGDAGVVADAGDAHGAAVLPNAVSESAPNDAAPLVTQKLEKSVSSWDDNVETSKSSILAPTNVRWQWEHRTGFRNYNPAESARIEAAYQRGAWMIRTKSGEGRKAKPREIYFADMIQYDPASNSIRNVRRDPEMNRRSKFSRFVLAALMGFVNGEDQWWKPKTREMFEEQRFGEQQEKLAEQIAAETYRVDTLACRIVKSWWFNTFAMTMILFNSIYIWVDADYNDGSSIMDTPIIFTLVDNVFLVWFLAEAIIRLRSFKDWFASIKDPWFALDLALVVLMIIETWVLQIIVYLAMGSSDSPDSQHLNKLSILRGLRLLRLVRVARLFKVFPQLFVLMKGMIVAMKSLFYVLLLLFVLTFVCAIVFKNLSDMNPELAALSYDSVGGSFWNLLIYGIFLDGVGEMLNGLKDANFMYAAAFLAFIFISNLTMLNMLIGILCEVIARVAEEEEDHFDRQELERGVLDILDCYDLDDDQSLSKEEFQVIMENPDLKVILDKYSVDLQALTRLQDILFIRKDLPDGSTSFSELKFHTFVEKVHQLRGGNSATVHDMVELRNWLKRRFNLLEGLDPDTAMRSRPGNNGGKAPMTQNKTFGSQVPGTITEDHGFSSDFQKAVLSKLDSMHKVQLKMDSELARLNEEVVALSQ